MSNIFTSLFLEKYGREIDLSRVREDFRDQVYAAMERNVKDGRRIGDFVPVELNNGKGIVGGDFRVLCRHAYDVFGEGLIDELLKMSGGKQPAAGPGEILLTALFSNVRSADRGDVVIGGRMCEIKSIRGGGGPYSREVLLDKLKIWENEHGIDLSGVEWNPSGIGALLPLLKQMDDEGVGDLAVLMAGEGQAETVYKEFKRADELGPKVLLQHLASCQMKGYCDLENGSDLLIVMPEEKTYLWLPNDQVLEVGNYVKFGGWGQHGFLISKLTVH